MKKTIGVIIGRFQTAELTPGHKFLFEEVQKLHDKIILLLGTKPDGWEADKKYPLDYRTRVIMMLAYNPNLIISRQEDNETNPNWSNEVDKKLDSLRGDTDVILYGSRDSFIPYYSGKFKTVEIETPIEAAATNERERIASEPLDTHDFRCGVIYNEYNRKAFPVPYSYALVVNRSNGKTTIALTRDKQRDIFNLFHDVYKYETDQRYTDTANRSIREQGGYNLELNPKSEYITDAQINHWSCRSNSEKIHGTFFLVEALWGNIKGTNNFEPDWFTIEQFEHVILAPELDNVRTILLDKIKEFDTREPLKVCLEGFAE